MVRHYSPGYSGEVREDRWRLGVQGQLGQHSESLFEKKKSKQPEFLLNGKVICFSFCPLLILLVSLESFVLKIVKQQIFLPSGLAAVGV